MFNEVENKLIKIAGGTPKENAKTMQKSFNSKLPYLGLTIPELRIAFKEGYSFSNLPPQNQLKIWNSIWNKSKYGETLYQPLIYIEQFKTTKELIEIYPIIKGWVERIENWGHSDMLSKIYSRILEVDPHIIYNDLRKWNGSIHLWKRRQSIVSLLYYSSNRKIYPPVEKILPLIKNLLDDKEYYVQKGVGWSLRETGNIYPKITWEFLQHHALNIKSQAFSTAIEKLPLNKKEYLKNVRKKYRLSKHL